VVNDLLEHDRQRAAALAAAGLARWKDEAQSTWKYTIAGAFRLASASSTLYSVGTQGKKRAEALGYPTRGRSKTARA
jgi:hypothetical protein